MGKGRSRSERRHADKDKDKDKEKGNGKGRRPSRPRTPRVSLERSVDRLRDRMAETNEKLDECRAEVRGIRARIAVWEAGPMWRMRFPTIQPHHYDQWAVGIMVLGLAWILAQARC